MNYKSFWLSAAALALMTLAFTDGDAQQPGKKGPPFGKKGGPFGAAVTSEQIIERLSDIYKFAKEIEEAVLAHA